MDHLAIMKPSWKLLPKILSREKTIESRWYKTKYAPWNNINQGDKIYFKDSGKPVTLEAEVDRVIQYESLTPLKVREILSEYNEKLGIPSNQLESFAETFSNKKYCILIFLKNPQKINPFEINKKGYGMGSAWISVDRIEKLRQN